MHMPISIRAVCLGYDLICVNTTPPNTLDELPNEQLEPPLQGASHRAQLGVCERCHITGDQFAFCEACAWWVAGELIEQPHDRVGVVRFMFVCLEGRAVRLLFHLLPRVDSIKKRGVIAVTSRSKCYNVGSVLVVLIYVNFHFEVGFHVRLELPLNPRRLNVRREYHAPVLNESVTWKPEGHG